MQKNAGLQHPFTQVQSSPIMEEEAEAVLVEKAYIKLTEGRYPEGASKNDKRSIRRKANTLAVQDGALYYKKKDGKKVSCVKINYYSASAFLDTYVVSYLT